MPTYRFGEDAQTLYFMDLHGLTRLTPEGIRTLTHATTGRWVISEMEARDALGDQAISSGTVGMDTLRGQSGSLDIAGEHLLVQYNEPLEAYPNRIEFISLPQLQVDIRSSDPFGIPPDVHFFSGNKTVAYVQSGELVVASWQAFAPKDVVIGPPEARARGSIPEQPDPSRIAGFYLQGHVRRGLTEIRFGKAVSAHRPDAGSPARTQIRKVDDALAEFAAKGFGSYPSGPEGLTSRFRLSPDGAYGFFDGAEHRLYYGRLTWDDFVVHWQAPVSIDTDLLTIAPANNGMFVGAQLGDHVEGYFIQPDGSRTRFAWEAAGIPERIRNCVVYQVDASAEESSELVYCGLRDGRIERRASVEVRRRVRANRDLPLSGAGQIMAGRNRLLWLPWHGLSIFDLDADREISRRLGGKLRLLRLYFASRSTAHAVLIDGWIQEAVAEYIVHKAEEISDVKREALVLGAHVYCWNDDARMADWLSTAVQTAWDLYRDGYARSIQIAGGPVECDFMSKLLEKLGYRPSLFNPARPTYSLMKPYRRDRVVICGPMPDLARRVFLARAAHVDAIGFDTNAASGFSNTKLSVG